MHMQGKAVDVIMTGKTDTERNSLYKRLLMQVSKALVYTIRLRTLTLEIIKRPGAVTAVEQADQLSRGV